MICYCFRDSSRQIHFCNLGRCVPNPPAHSRTLQLSDRVFHRLQAQDKHFFPPCNYYSGELLLKYNFHLLHVHSTIGFPSSVPGLSSDGLSPFSLELDCLQLVGTLLHGSTPNTAH